MSQGDKGFQKQIKQGCGKRDRKGGKICCFPFVCVVI